MKLPEDTLTSEAKITRYLLVRQVRNDKSKWLAYAGYGPADWRRLQDGIRDQLLPLETVSVERTRFGVMFEIVGELTGPSGVALMVRSYWMREHDTGLTKFVTLYRDSRRGDS